MHQTRQEASTLLPIRRKGTKYVARPLSHLNSVPVVIAVRDMLGLAKTASEVRKMIKSKLLKLNGRPVRDYRDSIRIFNIFEAGNSYVLTLTEKRKFAFEKIKEKSTRLCKVANRRLASSDIFQLNMHDGTNVLTKDKNIKVNDSVYLDFDNNIKKHIPLETGKEVFIFKGKYIGSKGKVKSIENQKAKIEINNNQAELNKSNFAVI